MNSPGDFLPNDPLRPPEKPEYFPEDYDDNLEEDCPNCGNQLGVHSTKEIVICALREIRGDIKN